MLTVTDVRGYVEQVVRSSLPAELYGRTSSSADTGASSSVGTSPTACTEPCTGWQGKIGLAASRVSLGPLYDGSDDSDDGDNDGGYANNE